jgi:hypothetical protein
VSNLIISSNKGCNVQFLNNKFNSNIFNLNLKYLIIMKALEQQIKVTIRCNVLTSEAEYTMKQTDTILDLKRAISKVFKIITQDYPFRTDNLKFIHNDLIQSDEVNLINLCSNQKLNTVNKTLLAEKEEIRYDYEALDDYENSSDYDIFANVIKQKGKLKETEINFLGNKRKREEDLKKFIKLIRM